MQLGHGVGHMIHAHLRGGPVQVDGWCHYYREREREKTGGCVYIFQCVGCIAGLEVQ